MLTPPHVEHQNGLYRKAETQSGTEGSSILPRCRTCACSALATRARFYQGRLFGRSNERIAAVMRDKYFDPDGWRQCTLRHTLELGQRLWLLCGTCQKSRDLDVMEWATKHGVNLDTPLRTSVAIHCQRCGTRGVSAYGTPYNNLPPQPRHRMKDDPICPRCGSDDVLSRRMLTTDYPSGCRPRFKGNSAMFVCGCYSCDNWWTQAL
jgi:hypothetical protein